ncbi:hypothetical protein VTI28DRAFT_603 [Corynascus sepedonium]
MLQPIAASVSRCRARHGGQQSAPELLGQRVHSLGNRATRRRNDAIKLGGRRLLVLSRLDRFFLAGLPGAGLWRAADARDHFRTDCRWWCLPSTAPHFLPRPQGPRHHQPIRPTVASFFCERCRRLPSSLPEVRSPPEPFLPHRFPSFLSSRSFFFPFPLPPAPDRVILHTQASVLLFHLLYITLNFRDSFFDLCCIESSAPAQLRYLIHLPPASSVVPVPRDTVQISTISSQESRVLVLTLAQQPR